MTVQERLMVEKYRTDIFNPIVVPHFDNHPLRGRLVYTDDNARPHTARAVVRCLQQEVIATLQLPENSQDLNPIGHSWT